MEQRTLSQHHGGHQAEDHQREKFRGPELQRHGGKRRTKAGDQKCRHGPGEKRTDGRSCERCARPSLFCHLVAVERRNDGGCFAGEIDKDRGGRTAVLGTIVNARQHD